MMFLVADRHIQLHGDIVQILLVGTFMDIDTHTCSNYLIICNNLNCNRSDNSLCSQSAPIYNFNYYELEIIYASITIYIF